MYIEYRPSGGAACAPSAGTDSGDYLGSLSFFDANGTFSRSEALTWRTPGTFVFWIWIASSSSAVSTPFTTAITFRAPTGTITATINPITPLTNQEAAITVTGASEAPGEVYAKVRPAGGAACAPTHRADSGTSVLYGADVNGAFSIPATTTQQTAGSYLLCLWLARSDDDPAPFAGPQPQLFNVAAPPKPCIVPKVYKGIRLSTMKKRLRVNHCTVGSIRYVRSRKYARNTVARLNPRSATQLRPGARVTIYMSSGRPR